MQEPITREFVVRIYVAYGPWDDRSRAVDSALAITVTMGQLGRRSVFEPLASRKQGTRI